MVMVAQIKPPRVSTFLGNHYFLEREDDHDDYDYDDDGITIKWWQSHKTVAQIKLPRVSIFLDLEGEALGAFWGKLKIKMVGSFHCALQNIPNIWLQGQILNSSHLAIDQINVFF